MGVGGVESRVSLNVVTCGLQRGCRRCRESDLSERGYLRVLADLCALTDCDSLPSMTFLL